MDWTQVLTIVGSNLALFLWAMRQSRSDFFHLDKKMEDNRRETNQIIKAIHDQVLAIQAEVKDFHNRLCKIEENKGK